MLGSVDHRIQSNGSGTTDLNSPLSRRLCYSNAGSSPAIRSLDILLSSLSLFVLLATNTCARDFSPSNARQHANRSVGSAPRRSPFLCSLPASLGSMAASTRAAVPTRIAGKACSRSVARSALRFRLTQRLCLFEVSQSPRLESGVALPNSLQRCAIAEQVTREAVVHLSDESCSSPATCSLAIR